MAARESRFLDHGKMQGNAVCALDHGKMQGNAVCALLIRCSIYRWYAGVAERGRGG